MLCVCVYAYTVHCVYTHIHTVRETFGTPIHPPMHPHPHPHAPTHPHSHPHSPTHTHTHSHAPSLDIPADDKQLLHEVISGLTDRGASQEIIQLVSDALQRQREAYMTQMQELENRRQTLVQIASNLVVREWVGVGGWVWVSPSDLAHTHTHTHTHILMNSLSLTHSLTHIHSPPPLGTKGGIGATACIGHRVATQVCCFQ